MCQLHDVEQADVPFPALYSADVVAVQFCNLRKLLLREFAFNSELADTSSEYDSGVGIRHPAILRR